MSRRSRSRASVGGPGSGILTPFTSNQVGAPTAAASSYGFTSSITTGLIELVLFGAGTGVANYWQTNGNLEVPDQFQFVNRTVTGDFEIACRSSNDGPFSFPDLRLD